MKSNPGCCDWTSSICVICHARGDRRIGVHMADEISLVRNAYARTDDRDRLDSWWVELLALECGCTAWRVNCTATSRRHLATERCPNRCGNAASSWLSRTVTIDHVYLPPGRCADLRDTR